MRSTSLLHTALVSSVLAALGCSGSSGPGATLVVTPDSILLNRNSTSQLSVTALDAAGHLITGVAVEFNSDDTLIVTVTNLGLVQSHDSVGNTTIRVRGAGAFRDVPVRVIPTPASVAISPADTTIFQYDTARFRAVVLAITGDTIRSLPITWSSTDTTIATVTTSGLARSAGRASTTFIQARYQGLSNQARLIVRDTVILGNRVTLSGQPYGAAISSTGVAYVTLGSAAQLARTNLPSQAFAPAVAVGSVPTAVAFNSGGTIAYVTNQLSQNLGVVDVATNTQTDVIPVNGDPFVVIVQPGDSIIYVSTNVNRVYGIRVATKALVDSFPTPAIGGLKGLFAAILFHMVLNRLVGMMLPGNGLRDRLPAAKLPDVEFGS